MEDKRKSEKLTKTILDTVELLNQTLDQIKNVDLKKYEEMEEKLEQMRSLIVVEGFDAFELINSLMSLSNEMISFLTISLNKQYSESRIHYENTQNTDLQLYVSPKKNIKERIGI